MALTRRAVRLVRIHRRKRATGRDGAPRVPSEQRAAGHARLPVLRRALARPLPRRRRRPHRLRARAARDVAAQAGATALELTPGENRNLFVTATTTAQGLGLARISDLARYGPAAAPWSMLSHPRWR